MYFWNEEHRQLALFLAREASCRVSHGGCVELALNLPLRKRKCLVGRKMLDVQLDLKEVTTAFLTVSGTIYPESRHVREKPRVWQQESSKSSPKGAAFDCKCST